MGEQRILPVFFLLSRLERAKMKAAQHTKGHTTMLDETMFECGAEGACFADGCNLNRSKASSVRLSAR